MKRQVVLTKKELNEFIDKQANTIIEKMLKKEILRKKSDFDRIYRRGRSVGDKYIVLFLFLL